MISFATFLLKDGNVPVITNILEEDKHPNNSTAFLIHFIFFFILYYFLSYIINKNLNLLIFCLFYSIIIEYLQIFTGRGFQYLDIVFNIIGIVTAFTLLRLNEK